MTTTTSNIIKKTVDRRYASHGQSCRLSRQCHERYDFAAALSRLTKIELGDKKNSLVKMTE